MEQLYYKSFGSGSPLFILHGLLGSGDNWATLAKKYGETYEVIVPDWRNHGRSFHDDDHNFPAMIDDLLRLMDDLSINEADFIGHSMGGKALMYLTNHFPDKVQKQIIVDIAPRAYSGGHEYIFAAMESLDLEEVDSRKEAEENFGEYITDPAVRLFLLKNLKREGDHYKWKPNLKAIKNGYKNLLTDVYPEELHSIDTPTLFVKGEKSNYIQNEDVPSIEKYYNDVRFVTIPDSGHWVHAEQPELFYEVTFNYLKENT